MDGINTRLPGTPVGELRVVRPRVYSPIHPMSDLSNPELMGHTTMQQGSQAPQSLSTFTGQAPDNSQIIQIIRHESSQLRSSIEGLSIGVRGIFRW